MPWKSILKDKKGEFMSTSRKGVDVKFAYGMISRSQAVVQDGTVAPPDYAFKQSSWAFMPQELLRDVLMRIEASESTWPCRRNVISCAGVCSNWREIVKEIVKSLEISGMVTFPVSLKQPGPRNCVLQCYIKRNRNSQMYYLYLGLNPASNDDGKFLLVARRCRRPMCTDYVISLNCDDVCKSSNTCIGKLRSNFLGTKFVVHDGQMPIKGAKFSRCHSTRLVNRKQVSPQLPIGSYPVVHITYELNVLGSRGPRRMHCVMDAIPASAVEPDGVAPVPTEFFQRHLEASSSISLLRSRSSHIEKLDASPSSKDGLLILKNKSPRWHEQLQCWCLNFNGRVTVASVKNFQLVASPEDETAGEGQEGIILQFGKVGKDVFTMDYQYPISAFQAFAICLSSFDTKIACE